MSRKPTYTNCSGKALLPTRCRRCVCQGYVHSTGIVTVTQRAQKHLDDFLLLESVKPSENTNTVAFIVLSPGRKLMP